MKNTTRSLAAIGIALLTLAGANAQGTSTITQWTFDNLSTNVNNSPAPSTGSGTADAIGMSTYATPNVGTNTDDVLVGVSADTGSNTVADTTQTWRVRGQASVNGAANGWSSSAPTGTQGAQFFVSTTNATSGTIQISFDWYTTKQGEANLQFEYTTNSGTSWINAPLTLGGNDSGLRVLTNSSSANTVMGSYVSDNLLSNGLPAGQDWFPSLTATIADPNALNDSGFGIEFVNASTGVDCVGTPGTALNNNSGNWRFDNVTVSGVSAVPEPASYALLGLGALVGMIVYRRRDA